MNPLFTTGCPLCGSRNWAAMAFTHDPVQYECHDCGREITRPGDADKYETS
jgi:DNA-directed RNA polymerase subunit RPC12/RpoP